MSKEGMGEGEEAMVLKEVGEVMDEGEKGGRGVKREIRVNSYHLYIFSLSLFYFLFHFNTSNDNNANYNI